MPRKATSRNFTKEDLEEIIREELENFIYEDVAPQEKQDMSDTLLSRKPDPFKVEDQLPDYSKPPIGVTLGAAKATAKGGKTVSDDIKKGVRQVKDTGFGATIAGSGWHPKVSGGARSGGPKLGKQTFAASYTGAFQEQKKNMDKQIILEELEKLLHEQTI